MPVVALVELFGLRLDTAAAERARWFASEDLRAAERAWIDWCEKVRFGPVDHRSDARVRHVLQRLGFRVRNVEKKTLRRLDHPFIDALLRVRDVDRLLSGVERMQAAVGPGNRLRGVFDQLGTVTGRIVVRSLDLQNIARDLRHLIVPTEGYVFVLVDVAGQDLQVLADLAHDDRLLEVVQRGGDLHTAIAAVLFEMDPSDIDADRRQAAKAVNLGITYGKTPWGLGRDLDIPLPEARGMIDLWNQAFPGAAAFIRASEEQARRDRVSRSLLGRVMPHEGRKDVIRRQGRSYPIQGSASDIYKERLIALHELLQSKGWGRIVLTVHDAYLMEIHAELVEVAMPEIKTCIESSPLLDLPMRTTIGAGSTWADAENNKHTVATPADGNRLEG